MTTTSETLALAPVLEAAIRRQVSEEVERQLAKRARKTTIIAFSGDMDKLLAAFVIATGAAAMGFGVSIFFTFWGLCALKKESLFKGKSLTEQMITALLSSGPGSLPVSRMNMLGLGGPFFRRVMKKKGVISLEELIDLARESDVRMIACEMSMAVMGIRREELLDCVELGGVATYLADASESGITLFL